MIMDCKEVNDEDHDYVDATVNALVDVLGLDEDDIRKRLTDPATSSSQYQILKKELSMDEKKAFEEYADPGEDSGLSDKELKERANIQGIWFEEDYLRVYPFNDLACDTIGFTLSRETADSGLEGYYNSTLMGTDGRQYGYINDNADVEQTISGCRGTADRREICQWIQVQHGSQEYRCNCHEAVNRRDYCDGWWRQI